VTAFALGEGQPIRQSDARANAARGLHRVSEFRITSTAPLASLIARGDPCALGELAGALAPYLRVADTESPYLTTREAAEFLRCKPQRIHDLLSARRLTRIKEGRRTLVLRAELEGLLGVGTPIAR
jgi:excisionase family DNA binding protein